ncbi:ribonuclease HI [Oscillatoria sp. FACHB-1407]|uniref:ribonuclease HI n=1 Tax=Oscillatoria sp. FACHB-1407 TaxID=2692847 RepID=UPI00281628D9|nr:ribonuclease HI [Oscillatoria sp. FACHB-1407]
MLKVSIEDAAKDLRSLLERVSSGEAIILMNQDKEVAHLIPPPERHPASSEAVEPPGAGSNTPRRIQSIYTDGACSGNPGRGGWGTVVYFTDGTVHEMGGADSQTTNNRMEMQAAIAALQFYKESGQPEPITLYTDSEYVMKGATQWIQGWKKKGWKTAAGKAVLNQDLWEEIDRLNSKQVTWKYVRGHSGNVGNERCDAIARSFSMGKPVLN